MCLFEDEHFKEHPSTGYSVSQYGKVKGRRTDYLSHFPSHDERYLYVQIRSRSWLVHRLVYESFVGPVPHGLEINHIDGNRYNNHLSNLEAVTPSENVKHAFRLGLRSNKRGQDHYAATLTEVQILEIYDLIRNGINNKEIGAKYEIDPKTVSLIRHGHTWAHLHKVAFPLGAPTAYHRKN